MVYLIERKFLPAFIENRYLGQSSRYQLPYVETRHKKGYFIATVIIRDAATLES